MSYDHYAVVRVPFPFTDKTASKRRPALVISDEQAFNAPSGHLVLAMIRRQNAQAGRSMCRWIRPARPVYPLRPLYG